VIERAKGVLAKLEKYELAVFADESAKGLAMAAGKKAASQTSLFDLANDAAINELRNASVDSMSAEDGLNLLKELRSKIV
jgi:hypothetical protein